MDGSLSAYACNSQGRRFFYWGEKAPYLQKGTDSFIINGTVTEYNQAPEMFKHLWPKGIMSGQFKPVVITVTQ